MNRTIRYIMKKVCQFEADKGRRPRKIKMPSRVYKKLHSEITEFVFFCDDEIEKTYSSSLFMGIPIEVIAP